MNQGMLFSVAGHETIIIYDVRTSENVLLHLLGRTTPEKLEITLNKSATPKEREKHARWLNQLNQVALDEESKQTIAEYFDSQEQANATQKKASNAIRSLETIAYPLTTLGMLLSVYAVGHLLLYRPSPTAHSGETDDSVEMKKMVRTSLILLIIFSGMDLVWTILAHSAGQMRELNPIGNQLIANPVNLAAFKVTATAVAVALLFTLRRFKRAQLATWWACLVLTMLTIRWVALNSMFVS